MRESDDSLPEGARPTAWPGRARCPRPARPDVVVGCAGEALAIPPQELVVKPWANLGEQVPGHDGDSDAVAGLSQVLAGQPPTLQPGKPIHILVMSGGGKYGAFTAGALVGWTAAGTRPTFDVATGISSGAIVATLAFLGPKYDENDPVLHPLAPRPLCVAADSRALQGNGLMTAEPLEKLLAQEINDEFMCDLAPPTPKAAGFTSAPATS